MPSTHTRLHTAYVRVQGQWLHTVAVPKRPTFKLKERRSAWWCAVKCDDGVCATCPELTVCLCKCIPLWMNLGKKKKKNLMYKQVSRLGQTCFPPVTSVCPVENFRSAKKTHAHRHTYAKQQEQQQKKTVLLYFQGSVPKEKRERRREHLNENESGSMVGMNRGRRETKTSCQFISSVHDLHFDAILSSRTDEWLKWLALVYVAFFKTIIIRSLPVYLHHPLIPSPWGIRQAVCGCMS